MMWGRRRSSKSSSKAALISSVFPVSWFSKLKQRNDKSCAAGSGKEKGRCNAEPIRIAEEQGSWRNGRLHGGDEKGSWRLSFRDEGSVDGRKSGCYDSGYGHEHEVLPYSCKEEVGQGEMEGLGEMVLNLSKMKEMNMFDAENLQTWQGDFMKGKGFKQLREVIATQPLLVLQKLGSRFPLFREVQV